jgi:rhodanese-related sulfurtransferase
MVLIKALNTDQFEIDAKEIHELSLKQEHILSLQQYKQLKEKDSTVVLIDLRTKEDFEEGTLQNAKNIPFTEILKSPELHEMRLKNTNIVLYSNAIPDCSSAWVILSQMGFKKLYILDIASESMNKNFNESDSLSGGNEILKYTFSPDSID